MGRLCAGHCHDHWRSTCWLTEAGPPETPRVSPGRAHTSVHRGAAGQPSWPSWRQPPQPPRASESPEPASPGGPTRPVVPAQRTARAQTRDATSSCDLARLRPISPNTAQGEERPEDPPCSVLGAHGPNPPPHTAWPQQVSRRPGSAKDHARGGAV